MTAPLATTVPPMRVANAPVSFGIFELTTDDPNLPAPNGVLDAMAAGGYVGTELGPPGYFGDGQELRDALAQRSLTLAGAFLPLRFSRAEAFAEDAAALDRWLAILERASSADDPPVALLSDAFCEPERMALSGRIEEHREAWLPDARWPVLLDALHRHALSCCERGFPVAFHHHAGTYVETPREIDRLVEGLDRSLLGLCFDSGHLAFGGGDPSSFLATYGEAVTHVHLKDVDGDVLATIRREGLGLEEAWRRDAFCRLGTGVVDVPRVIGDLERLGYDGWLVVEQDRHVKPGQTVADLAADQDASRALLRQLGI